jgi:hypothetical protein
MQRHTVMKKQDGKEDHDHHVQTDDGIGHAGRKVLQRFDVGDGAEDKRGTVDPCGQEKHPRIGECFSTRKEKDDAQNRDRSHEGKGRPCGVALSLRRDLVKKPLHPHEHERSDAEDIPVLHPHDLRPMITLTMRLQFRPYFKHHLPPGTKKPPSSKRC